MSEASNDDDFQNMVREILDGIPQGLSVGQFRVCVQPFLNACYRDEVIEAERQYFCVKVRGESMDPPREDRGG
ncbi:hypothetical protein AFIC_001029 [[Pseudomonas] carboxydohydrogena]|uniref:Uncharacterized protein n=1 Tax=Afipia carboxydohydrogena TaxID=290 RepID=A0ABY8BRB4_AFICR|nr:hypothetical protein [[Pseudomonas] carboxydohydrogena]WEF52538.1 hypothetical protein AFIC_001029 [[Pseudomonas] carboxydohydrogena]